MCRFASFVLTRDQEVWIRDEDSHEVIIDHYKLHADAVDGVRVNILRVELVPPPEGVDPSDLAAWSYFVDQDIVPDWHEIDPDRSESRSRAALARRAAREGWFVSVTVGDGGTATAGYHGTATAGHGGTALVGDRGAATAGDGGTLVFRRRACTVTAVVGEDGILPGVSYYMDAAGEIVRAP